MSIKKIQFESKIINNMATSRLLFPENIEAEELVTFGAMLVKELQAYIIHENNDARPTVDEVLGLLKVAADALDDILDD